MISTVDPLHLADFSGPSWHPRAGERVPVFAFLVRHPRATVLIDTGLGEPHPDVDRVYRPARRSLVDALAAHRLKPSDIDAIINTHLHFDHSGHNVLFPDRPIFVQAKEFEAAHAPNYTILEAGVFPGSHYQQVDGTHEAFPGVKLIPTPGHTLGHQSVTVQAEEGLVLLAGQAAETAAELRLGRPRERNVASAYDAGRYVESFYALRKLAPKRTYVSHDSATWTPTTPG